MSTTAPRSPDTSQPAPKRDARWLALVVEAAGVGSKWQPAVGEHRQRVAFHRAAKHRLANLPARELAVFGRRSAQCLKHAAIQERRQRRAAQHDCAAIVGR